MVTEGQAAGLDVVDPLAIDDEMRAAAVRAVGRHGTELERLQRLNRWLRGSFGFTYDAAATRTAREAFHARSGDCLSYAHLFNALARHVGVSMGYVR